MGSKYLTVSVSGFNASPPSDSPVDTSASNQLEWAKHINKIGAPLKTALESINSELVTALDQSARAITSSDSAVATDHDKTIQIASTTSPAITLTLSDAATMGAGYVVTISNQSGAYAATIARATGGDTIDGVAASATLPVKSVVTYQVNSAANGYITKSAMAGIPTSTIFTASGTWTKPAGLRAIKVELVGGGGGSGGIEATGAGESASSAGAGGGAYARKIILASALGATETVTIGAGGAAGAAGLNAGGSGGTTSFGSHCTAVGGSPGNPGGTSSSVIHSGSAGRGGLTGTGDIVIPGNGGGFGIGGGLASKGAGGQGGGSFFGGGAASLSSSTTTPGLAGEAHTGGGASGAASGQSQSASAGSAGASGLVIVTEFY